MDYNKIGTFITNERKEKNLTQAKLAEKLFVSEKTISKWENGKSLPDTEILPKLCEIFEISVNELLNGERITNEKYKDKAEEKLLDLKNIKEDSDKKLLALEIVIGILSIAILLSLIFVAAYVEMQDWLRIFLIVFAFVMCVFGLFVAIRIEQVAGYYKCSKCDHKYIPTFRQVFFAYHINRTRYLKCPKCHKRSMNKKVIK